MDRVLHGTTLRGENSGNHKLTWKQARLIRRLYATGRWFQKQLASRFSVSRSTISLIVLNETWKE
jgi:DNA-binding MarR family transcriptional regulator